MSEPRMKMLKYRLTAVFLLIGFVAAVVAFVKGDFIVGAVLAALVMSGVRAMVMAAAKERRDIEAWRRTWGPR